MYRYLLIEANDDGMRTAKYVLAKSPTDALRQTKLYPFVWPDDFVGTSTDAQLMLNTSGLNTFEAALDYVARYFYGIDMPADHDVAQHGNYVDGDSNSQYTLIELHDTYIIQYGAINYMPHIVDLENMC